jgi:guanylate kinase
MKTFAIAICAPSGVGKTTVARALVDESDDLIFSVSVTTRAPRPGEQAGIDYEFVSRQDFESMIAQKALLEWAEVHGDLYGTPCSNLELAERQGKILLLDIDVQGAEQVVEAQPDTVTIFLLPPSYTALIERLRGRASEDAVRLRRRMETARAELEDVSSFQYAVVNDQLPQTVALIRSIIVAERQLLTRRAAEVEDLRTSLLEALEKEAS